LPVITPVIGSERTIAFHPEQAIFFAASFWKSLSNFRYFVGNFVFSETSKYSLWCFSLLLVSFTSGLQDLCHKLV
jgi:hypothetical protein